MKTEDITLSLDLLGHQISPIRQTFFKALNSQVVSDERDETTRQRLLFTALLREHYDPLFNASGGPEDRAEKWEEIRQLMIEHGTHTLLDKDWKYVAGCYWQNIRKESIRRLAKLRVGAARQPRPAQMELDDAVTDIISRRGPNSLETVLRNYSKWHEDDEEQHVQLQLHEHNTRHNNHQQLDVAGSIVGHDHDDDDDSCAATGSDHHYQENNGIGPKTTTTRRTRRRTRSRGNSSSNAVGDEQQQYEQNEIVLLSSSKSASPSQSVGVGIFNEEHSVEQHQQLLSNHQSTLAQLVHNATASAAMVSATAAICCSPPSPSSMSASSTPARMLTVDHLQTAQNHHLSFLQQQQHHPMASTSSLPLFLPSTNYHRCLEVPPVLALSSACGGTAPKQQHQLQQQHGTTTSSSTSTPTRNAVVVHPAATPNGGGGGGGCVAGGSTSAATINDGANKNPSASLGKLVSRTHSLLLNGGFDGMANEFEQQVKQLITGYKAWMFDQLFQQDEDTDQTSMSTTLIMMDNGGGISGVSAGLASSNSNTTTKPTAGTTSAAKGTPTASSSSLSFGANVKRARMI